MIVTRGLGSKGLITKGYGASKGTFIPQWMKKFVTSTISLIKSIIVEIRL